MRFMGGCEQTETFLRLFLIPGVHHGRGGPRLTEFDALNALEKWVERGPPPKLIACHRDNGVIERCRPVFPYPDVGSLFRQTRSEGGREFRALRLLSALSSFCSSPFDAFTFRADCRQPFPYRIMEGLPVIRRNATRVLTWTRRRRT